MACFYPFVQHRPYYPSPPCVQSLLGSRQGLLEAVPSLEEHANGHVARNVRLSLMVVDLVEPYVEWAPFKVHCAVWGSQMFLCRFGLMYGVRYRAVGRINTEKRWPTHLHVSQFRVASMYDIYESYIGKRNKFAVNVLQ